MHPFPVSVDASRTPEQRHCRQYLLTGLLLGAIVASGFWLFFWAIVPALLRITP